MSIAILIALFVVFLGVLYRSLPPTRWKIAVVLGLAPVLAYLVFVIGFIVLSPWVAE